MRVSAATYLTAFLRVCYPDLYSYILQSPFSLNINFDISEGSSITLYFLPEKYAKYVELKGLYEFIKLPTLLSIFVIKN